MSILLGGEFYQIHDNPGWTCFFFVAYVVQAGIVDAIAAKFYWLYWEIGVASFAAMLFGCCVG